MGRPGAVQPSRQAGALVADHEDVPLVLDHAGVPVERTQDALGQWRRDFAAVAAEPNTMVKISALGPNGLPRRRSCIRSTAVSPTSDAFDEVTAVLDRTERAHLSTARRAGSTAPKVMSKAFNAVFPRMGRRSKSVPTLGRTSSPVSITT
ncbi:amidohydrolase family protein [Streptomyces sp. N50]|uniref:amidohydrolase family protein n=1 Tax=Streptomyces sp. N50 TaxID=3081765 RepID=UPI00398CDBE5